MLTALTIRNVVLIEALTIEFNAGLGVLTGETGAGKSILLDSLGLALGSRADSALVRTGASDASVVASFEVSRTHPARALLRDNDLPDDDVLLLRRVVKADGGSRAFINDQPVGVALLREAGDLLVEIHGQHDDRGLLNARGHRALLDAFGGHDALLAATRSGFASWQQALAQLDRARTELEQARADADWLAHAAAELRDAAPQPGEEDQLAERRQQMMNGEKIAEDLVAVAEEISASKKGGLPALRLAARRLERVVEQSPALLPVLQELDAAVDAASRAEDMLARVQADMMFDPSELEQAETRLFDLRALARKHKVQVDQLPALAQELADRLAQLDAGDAHLAELDAAERGARATFEAACAALGAARASAAARLDTLVAQELSPLKLEAATFRTVVSPLTGELWGASGSEGVAFQISTNPGAPFGDLVKIASGGELSRFILALKVVLAGEGTAGTLIFDEIDRGVGGAVAAAIGERLEQLGRSAQVLVVTHSPQVAARGKTQWRISKSARDGQTRTDIVRLASSERTEEIARMLSGDQVTAEARAQAGRLLNA